MHGRTKNIPASQFERTFVNNKLFVDHRLQIEGLFVQIGQRLARQELQSTWDSLTGEAHHTCRVFNPAIVSGSASWFSTWFTARHIAA